MSQAHSLLAQVARDFLEADESGRYRLRAEGARAVRISAEIVTRLGLLAPALDELLRLCVLLERARSLEAATDLEEAVAAVPAVGKLLGVRTGASLLPHLRRRRLRLLNKPRSQAHFQVRDMLAQAPHARRIS